MLPRTIGHDTVDTKECNKQIGSVLLQEQPDRPARPIGKWSRTLNGRKRELGTTDPVCLAVVWAVLLLRARHEGRRFTLRTNYEALEWLLTVSNLSGKLAHCRLRLSVFEINVVHCKCIKDQATDAMSRLPADETGKTRKDDYITVFGITTNMANTDKTEE